MIIMKIKKTAKTIIIILIFLVFVLPYIIPIEEGEIIPIKPFENSYFINIEGLELHYRIWSPITNDIKGKIVLIHGLGGSTFSFRNNVEFLSSQGYYVVAVDLPAFGYSTRVRGINHSQSNRAKLIWHLLDGLDQELKEELYDNKWTILGHSMGASTAIEMANQNETAVRTLIFVAGAVTTNRESPTIFKIPPINRWARVILSNFLINEKRISSFLESAYGKKPSSEDVQGYLQPLLTNGTGNSLVDFVLTSRNTTISELNVLNLNIILIWGELDSWVSVEEIAKIKDIIPNVYFTILEGEGHCPNETSPLFNEVLLKYLILLNKNP